MSKRAYRYRFYPTPEQSDLLARTFGCVRVVYNSALRFRIDAYRSGGESIGCVGANAYLSGMKRDAELSWPREVSSIPLQQCLRHQQKAFANVFADPCLCEFEPEARPRVPSRVGVDLGLSLSHLAILSSGERIANPRHRARHAGKTGGRYGCRPSPSKQEPLSARSGIPLLQRGEKPIELSADRSGRDTIRPIIDVGSIIVAWLATRRATLRVSDPPRDPA